MDNSQTYHRGDIFLADLGSYFGSEQGGTRPVLILQNDTGNFHSPTLIVAPMTANIWKKADLPTHYRIEGRDKLPLPSVVMLEQITTIDKRRLRGYLNRLNEKEMQEVDRMIEISLGLREVKTRPWEEGSSFKMTRRDRYNGSGCLDMTTYLALKNIERQESAKRREQRKAAGEGRFHGKKGGQADGSH